MHEINPVAGEAYHGVLEGLRRSDGQAPGPSLPDSGLEEGPDP